MSEKETEEKILESAREVFIEKGHAGARMQEIADKAGINKALLHYYFRTKEKLFNKIFVEAVSKFWPKLEVAFTSGLSFRDLIESFVGNYIAMLLKNPHLPLFVMQELSKNSQKIPELLLEAGAQPQLILGAIKMAMENEGIYDVNPKEVVINTMSLCIFPFASKPVMQKLFFEGDKKAYKAFLEERKTTVAHFVLKAYNVKRIDR